MGKKERRARADDVTGNVDERMKRETSRKKTKVSSGAAAAAATAPSTVTTSYVDFSDAARATRVAPPPPIYHIREAPVAAAAAAGFRTHDLSDDGSEAQGRARYLMPTHSEYAPCLAQSYVGFHVDEPSIMRPDFHDDVTGALNALVDAGHFHYDVLAAGKSVSPTFVQRTLVGERGMTYHYQKLRIFAHPWADADTPEGSPLRVVRELNETLRARTRQLLRASPDPRVGAKVSGSCEFNVTLINLMEPAHKCTTVQLKEEGQYGMGNASVSWHSDSSLEDLSTVAVYHQTVGLTRPRAL